MRILLVCLIVAGFVSKAQQNPLSFTLGSFGFNPPTSITCATPSLFFEIASDYTLSPVSFSWTNGNAVYNGTLVSINSPGVYTVTAFTNSLSLTSTLSVPINTVAPVSGISPLSQAISCGSSPALVTATTSAQSSLHYFVSPLGGTMVAQGTSVNYFPGVAGTYTHILMDSLNGCTTQSTFTVTGAPGFPTFSLTSAENFTIGCSTKSVATVTISQASSSPMGNLLSYTITPSASYLLSNATTFSFNMAGTYTVVVKDNISNCETKIPISIIENKYVPFPDVTGISIPEISCKQPTLHVKYYPTAQGNFSFGWGTTGPPAFPIVNHPYDTLTIFADPNPATIGFDGPWAILIDNNSLCEAAISTSIKQDMLPPLTKIKSANGHISCAHPVASLMSINQSSSPWFPPGIVSAYLWEGPSPLLSSTLSSGYLAPVAGIYTVHVRDSKSGCTSTDTILIKDTRVFPQVSLPLQSFEFCNALTTIQPVNSSTVPLLFSWSSSANIITNPTLSQVTINSAGIYTLLVTNPANSCSLSLQFTVNVCSGLEEYSSDTEISVYPNPSAEFIFVETKVAEQVILMDAGGKIITTKNIEEGKAKIDMTNYPSGVYFINSKNGNSARMIKVVKEN